MKNKAFTLVEFLVILAIIFVLLAQVLASKPKITMVGSCQYLSSYNGYGRNLTHLGNCTNSIHLYNTHTNR